MAKLPKRLPDGDRARAAALEALAELAVGQPPISPREIAEAYGLRINDVRFDSSHAQVAGFIDFTERAIYVNADDPYNRKTFTIAHELGHYVLHREHFREHPDQYNVLLRRPMSTANSALEKEANIFAGHLLVPRKFLDKYYQLASTSELASLFAVSADVVRIRIQQEYASDAKS